MKKEEFFEKLNSPNNFAGRSTYSYVKSLLEEDIQEENIKKGKRKRFKKLFGKVQTRKSATDTIKENFLKILRKTHYDSKMELLTLIIENPKLSSLIEMYFEDILKDLDKQDVENKAKKFFSKFYDGSQEKKEFIIQNVIGKIDYALLLAILPLILEISPELKDSISQDIEGNKTQVSRDILLKGINYENLQKGEVSELDINDYTKTLSIIIDELLQSENKTLSDITRVKNGGYNTVYRIGNKILKIGVPRESYELSNHPRIVQPLLRTNLMTRSNKPFGCLEIMDVLETDSPSINRETLYKIYKELRDVGIKWLDIKSQNVGVLKRANKPNLNNEDMYVFPEAVGFDKENDITLEKGEVVILDTDEILDVETLSECKYTTDRNYKMFEKRYEEERAKRLSSTLTRKQIRDLIFENKTPKNSNNVSILLNELANMSEEDLRRVLDENKSVADIEAYIRQKLNAQGEGEEQNKTSVKEQGRYI